MRIAFINGKFHGFPHVSFTHVFLDADPLVHRISGAGLMRAGKMLRALRVLRTLRLLRLAKLRQLL